MGTPFRTTIAILATFALMTADSAESVAQCSGGGRGGPRPATLSSGAFAEFSVPSEAVAFALTSQFNSSPRSSNRYPRFYAVPMLRLVSADQQQMLANRQQAAQHYEERQVLLSMRRQRAEATRVARARRTAARLRAKGETGQPSGLDDSELLFAADSRVKRSSF